MSTCMRHPSHDHKHGRGCGHVAIAHNEHTDYLHDGHLHHVHGDHVDEHVLEVNATNPDRCTADRAMGGHDQSHVHSPTCGHERIPHGNHVDYLVDGQMHHPHGDHCDNHGPVVVQS